MRMFYFIVGLVVAIVTLAGGFESVLAQIPGPPRGFPNPGRARGFRGPIDGQNEPVVVVDTGDARLIELKPVQAELKMTDDQKSQAKALVDQLKQDLKNVDVDSAPQLNSEERLKIGQEISRKHEEARKKAIEDIAAILDERQGVRFSQIRCQSHQTDGFTRDEIADKLDLTDEQRQKARKLIDEHAAAALEQVKSLAEAEKESAKSDSRRPKSRNSKSNHEKFFESALKARVKLNADLLAILTAKQKKTWKAMLGEPFDFQTPFPRVVR